MVQKYTSMNSTFFVNESNGKSILGHVVQTNQLNDQKICMNCIIQIGELNTILGYGDTQ